MHDGNEPDRKPPETGFQTVNGSGELQGGRDLEGLIPFMASAPIGLAVIRPDGRLERTNRTLDNMLGLSHVQQGGGSLFDWVAPAERASLARSLKRLAQGRMERIEIDLRVAAGLSKPGWVWLIAWVAGDRKDTGPRILCHLVDITERKEAELILRQTERRFRDVAEVTYDQIWETDDKFSFTYVYDPHNLPSFPGPEMQIGKRRWEIEGFEPFEPNGLSNHIDDLLHHRSFRDFRYSIIDPSGTRYYWRSSGRPVHDEQGRFLGYRGVSTNITGRTRAELALQQSESRFRAVVDHSPMQIHIRDAEGRYLLWNREAANIFGIAETAALGHRARQFLAPEIADVLAADDLTVLATGTVIEKEEQLEIGQRAYTFLSVKFPIRGTGDRIIAVGAISTDITERKAAELRIRESELKYRQLYEVANDAIFTFDSLGCVQDVNARGKELLGMPGEEIVGKTYRDLFPKLSEHSDILSIASNIARRGEYRCDGTVTSRAGAQAPVEVSWSRSEIKGQPIIQGIFRDVSKRKQAEQALRDSQEKVRQHAAEVARIQRIATVSELASAFAHQINQPINAVANYTNVCLRQLQNGQWQEDRFQETLGLARDQAQYAGQLVRELGDFIRRGKPEIAPYDLNTLLRSVLALTEPEFRRLGIQIDEMLATNLPKVPMEKVEIEQVILNLLINAMEAISSVPAGQRWVKVSSALCDDGKVLARIEDSGPGIPDHLRREIFEPFASGKTDNLGMGLALSRSIITRHRGRLWAEPPREGAGAVFCFHLPSQ